MKFRVPSRWQEGLRRVASPLVWTAYIALPIAGWGWFDGIPIGVLESLAIALVWWAWFAKRRLPGGAVLAALVIAKLLCGVMLVDRGLAARYYANDSWTPPVEHSVEFRRADITRVDQRLAFGARPGQDLPLQFFNDWRFNYVPRRSPIDRAQLGYSVVWEGFVKSGASSQPATFYLAATDGVTGSLAIDTREVLALNGASDRTGAVALAPGWHQLTIRIAAPYGSGRRVEAGEIIAGARVPFSGRTILTVPASAARLVFDAAVHWLSRGLDLFVFGWLTVLTASRTRQAWREARIGQLLWLGALVEAVLFASFYAGRLVILSGGDDWLTYEHLARVIAAGDPLLRQPGPTPGQGGPFYYQPLYPYFVALTHLVFGDALFGVALVQRLLLAMAVACVASMTRTLFGSRVGWIALIGGGLFMYAKVGRWSGVLLGEVLFTPLLVGWTWLLVRTAVERATTPRLVLAGVVGGIATLTRSPLLAAWPLVLPAWSAALRVRRLKSTIIVVAVMIAVVATATIRNWVVAGSFVPITSSFSVNLSVSNRAPRRALAPVPPRRVAVYEQLHLPAPLWPAAETMIQMPDRFFGRLWHKTLYAVGLFDLSGFGGGASGISLLYVGVWCAAIVAAVRVRTFPDFKSPQLRAVMAIPGLAAVSHLIVVVLFLFPVYNDRLIVPMYPLLVPYAALTCAPLVSWAQREVIRVAPFLLAALTALLFLPAFERSSDLTIVCIVTAAMLALASGGWPRVTTRAWLYIGYATWVVVAGVREIYMGNQPDFRQPLLFPLMVFAVARLTRERTSRYATLAALFLAAIATAVVSGPSLDLVRAPLLWAIVAAVTAGIALVMPGRQRTTRFAAVMAGVCIVVAALLPAMERYDFDLISRFDDIRGDLAAVQDSHAEAREELDSDLSELMTVAIRPLSSGMYTLRQAGVAGLWFLAFWLQAALAAFGRARSGPTDPTSDPAHDWRALAAWRGVLLALLAMALIGAVPKEWNLVRMGYPMLSLALVFGVAEALFTTARVGASSLAEAQLREEGADSLHPGMFAANRVD